MLPVDRDSRLCRLALGRLGRLLLYQLSYTEIIGQYGRMNMVGVRGFEPPTSWTQTRRATRLRYTPLYFTSRHLRSLSEIYGRPSASFDRYRLRYTP